jgi:predicted metal-dependent hydrolase
MKGVFLGMRPSGCVAGMRPSGRVAEMRPSGRVERTRLKAASPSFPVFIDYKPITRIRLKVQPNGIVRVTAPSDTPVDYVLNLLEKKRPWIERHLRIFRETRPVDKEEAIRTGTATRILGRQLTVQVEHSRRKRITRDDGRLVVSTPDPTDQAAVDRQFRRWWRQEAKNRFRETLDRLHAAVGRRGIPKPALRVTRMRTLWGSCSRNLHRINLNEYLLKAPQDCIDYVVLHELLHFLHPCHDKAFYAALTVHMPDWHQRKRLLDYEIVQGF